MKIFRMLPILLLVGCAFGVIDRTAEQVALVEECYSIVKPAFLYEARCADLNSRGFGNSKFCTGIQGFDPLPYIRHDGSKYEYQYPKSWSEYISDREMWDSQMFNKLLFEKQRTIIAPIDLGTRIHVIGIYEYPRGETGHVLVGRAKIASGQHQNTIVELPSPGGFSDTGPSWIKHWFYPDSGDIQLSEEYLQPCY